MAKFLVLLVLLKAHGLSALGGADVLLQNLDVQDDAPSEAQGSVQTQTFKLDDPFLAEIFTEWKSRKNWDFDANAWILRLLRHDFRGAAHLLSAIEDKLPGDFTHPFMATKAYLYWKLDLRQTFINTWLSAVQGRGFLSSSTGITLNAIVSDRPFDWVFETAPVFTSEQSAFLETLAPSTDSKMNLALKAWANLRSGIKAQPLLERIPAGHPMKIPMSRSVVLGYLKIADVAGAGKVLKRHLEPAIDQAKDLGLARKHYLNVARLLYQVGMFNESEEFYLKVPNDSEDYLKAQTELAWALLRRGQMGRLRGLLATLGRRDLFEDVFNPEVFLVRSITNLKLCQYRKVQEDFNTFIAVNKGFGREISRALEEGKPAPSDSGDYHIALAHRMLSRLEAERSALDELATQSIKAVLPAVGVQSHWKEAMTAISASREHQAQKLAVEHRRFWNNRRSVLREAVRKMRFVKVETISQLNDIGESMGLREGDRVSMVNSALKRGGGQQVFPFDEILWSDEMFNHYAEAENFCLSRQKTL